MAFIANGEAINESIEFISNNNISSFNADFAEGLDGILTDNDKRALKYSQVYGEPSEH